MPATPELAVRLRGAQAIHQLRQCTARRRLVGQANLSREDTPADADRAIVGHGPRVGPQAVGVRQGSVARRTFMRRGMPVAAGKRVTAGMRGEDERLTGGERGVDVRMARRVGVPIQQRVQAGAADGHQTVEGQQPYKHCAPRPSHHER